PNGAAQVLEIPAKAADRSLRSGRGPLAATPSTAAPVSLETVRLRKAIERHDVRTILDVLTRQSPTFTQGRLDSLLTRHINDVGTRHSLRSRILDHADTVALSSHPKAPPERYTSRTVLETEQAVLADAEVLAGD